MTDGWAVPILMYHVIGRPVSHARWPELYVLPADFERQMMWLADNGYEAVTLRQVYNSWQGGDALPSFPIVLTFDDGDPSHYENVLPLLRSLRWPGVINLTIRNQWHRPALRPRHVRALLRAGWELSAHTITHRDLTTLRPARLRAEVAGSRFILRRQFRVPVDFFCYPSGRYDDAVIDAVRAAGYLGATTTRYGVAQPDELFTLQRVRVNGSDGSDGFASKIEAFRV
jgi:peptidoglycan/xylan/chitin deacetylase (PgdA/CDA1 family)